ncbi:hypothetical protein BVJ53_04650 [Lacticaseibacillus chiayiensis]|uniref:Uncharacterized protein n=1 Tax=Lacticaseibacillus chiayiensis TaxID=2100821 RepID=A0A4Q1U713_9LACO|nr:hypothetical protein BVJ53_04650 [Lacticaseibacillus chiayiensis]
MSHQTFGNIHKYYLYTLFTQLRFTRIVNVIFLVHFLIMIGRKSRDFSHGMDRPSLNAFLGVFLVRCTFGC